MPHALCATEHICKWLIIVNVEPRIFFYSFPPVGFGRHHRGLCTCCGKETSPFRQAQSFEASFLCTARCSIQLTIRLWDLRFFSGQEPDPRSRTQTTPASTCRSLNTSPVQALTGSRYLTRPKLFFKYRTRPVLKIETTGYQVIGFSFWQQ